MKSLPIILSIAIAVAATTTVSHHASAAPLAEARKATPAKLDLDPFPAGAVRPGAAMDPRTAPVMKSLARLKEKLAAGQRDEFPVGTVAHGRSHFLALEAVMTWQEAERFAEAHGAHLAVLPTEKDREWFRRQFPSRQPLWIGAGRAAYDRWQWIDGSPWTAAGKLPGESSRHRHLALSATNAIISASSAETFGLTLQWRADGNNPATLQAQLARTAASANAKDPARIVYPLGTRTEDGSHYFFHEGAMSWDDARKLAKSLGAYLAVPSSAKEHKWISFAYGSALEDDEVLWLGGFRLKPGDRWQWLSAEPWNNAGWKPDQLTEDSALNRLALQKSPDSRSFAWVASDGSNRLAKGMLLEWGPARPFAAATAPDWKSWLVQTNRRLASEIDPELKALQKRRQPLLQDYFRTMRRLARNEGDRQLQQELETGLAAAEKAGRLLANLPDRASPQLRAQQEKSQTNLDALEWDYAQNINDYLQVYTRDLRKRSRELTDSGYLAIALRMNRILERIEDERFLPLLFSGTTRSGSPWASILE